MTSRNLKILFLLLSYIIITYQQQIFTYKFTFIYLSRIAFYFNDNNNIVYEINNKDKYNLTIGYANISYILDQKLYGRYKAQLTYYKYLYDENYYNEYILNNNNNNNIKMKLHTDHKIPEMFDKKPTVCSFRMQKSGSFCLNLDRAKIALHNMNLSLMLQSGYRTEYNEAGSYITPMCIPFNPEWASGYDGLVNNAQTVVVELDPNYRGYKCSSASYFIEETYSGWTGLAACCHHGQWISGGGYWAIIQIYSSDNENFGPYIHEVGHNMGFLHGDSTNLDNIGFLRDYQVNDGYGENSNYMGWASSPLNIPSPGQWCRVVNSGKLFIPWTRVVSSGTHKYRIFAWDFAYSRLFLGDNVNVRFNEDDIIDGIPFKYNTAALFVEYSTNTFNSKMPLVQYGSIALEYRWLNDGLNSYKNRGIKISTGITITKNNSNLAGFVSIVYSSNNDDISNYFASHLPLDYVKIPEVDIGTLRFKVTKFNQYYTENHDELLNLLEKKPEEVKLEDIPYVEVEVTHLPNVPYTPPTREVDIPPIIYSPSLSNCILTGYTFRCNIYTSISMYWIYLPPSQSTKNSLPRFYAGDRSNIIRGRLGMQSYRNDEHLNVQFAVGTMDIENVKFYTLNINKVNNPSGSPSINYHQNCYLFEKKNDEYVKIPNENTKYDLLYYENLNLSLYDSIYLTDNYNNMININLDKNVLNGHILFDDVSNIQGYSDLYLTLTKDRKINSRYYFYRTYYKEIQRIAILDFNQEKKEYKIKSASLNQYSTIPLINGPLLCRNNKWYYFIHVKTNLNDIIMIDFIGQIPNNLIIYLETEKGIFSKDLNFMSRFKDISYGLKLLEVMKSTGGWGEIYKYKFNQDVNIQSIRPVTTSSQYDPPPYISSSNREYKINDKSYKIECDETTTGYKFVEFTTNFLNNEIKFDKSTSIFTVVEQEDGIIPNKIVYTSILLIISLLI